MARNKYVQDYRLIETVTQKGRIKTEYEYRGAPYAFALTGEALKAAKRRMALSCLIAWLAFLAALLPSSTAMHTLYVALPFAFAALPLGLMSETLLSALTAKPPFEHRHADKLENRLPASCAFTAILPGASLLGELIAALCGKGLGWGDLVFSLGALLLCLCGAYAGKHSKQLLMRELH